MILPFLAILAVPYLIQSAGSVAGFVLGLALPGGALSMATKLAKSQAGAGAGAGSPGLAMTAALGPAALLTTPQGKAALSKGLSLATKARNGDPAARKRVAKIKAQAAAGDPVAKRSYDVMKSAQELREASQDEGGDDGADEGGE